MRLKTYTAPSTADALDLVRKDLGVDAVIVSIVEGAGEVSVTAALEDHVFEEEIEGALTTPNKDQDFFGSLCEKHNFSDGFVRHLADHFCKSDPKNSFSQRLEKGLQQSLSFQEIEFSNANTAPIVLVGPPGVGKTVTLAKLALKAQCDDHSVHLITTDTEKAGAVEQLLSYGNALSVEVTVASSMEKLWKALQKAPKNIRLLVDTPGINPFREDELKTLTEVILTLRISPILVMPAGGDVVDHMDMMEAFQRLGAGRVLLTRVDLSRRLGGVLDALHRSQLKCVGFNNSPYIADPLIDGCPRELARLLLSQEQDKHAFDYEWIEKEAAHG